MPTTAVTTDSFDSGGSETMRCKSSYTLPGNTWSSKEKGLKASNFNVTANWEYVAVTRYQRRNKTAQPLVTPNCCTIFTACAVPPFQHPFMACRGTTSSQRNVTPVRAMAIRKLEGTNFGVARNSSASGTTTNAKFG